MNNFDQKLLEALRIREELYETKNFDFAKYEQFLEKIKKVKYNIDAIYLYNDSVSINIKNYNIEYYSDDNYILITHWANPKKLLAKESNLSQLENDLTLIFKDIY